MNEENIEAKQPRKRKFTKDRLVPGLVLTLALSFLLGLYAPLELYFTNITEFQFDFWTLLPPLPRTTRWPPRLPQRPPRRLPSPLRRPERPLLPPKRLRSLLPTPPRPC